MWGGTLSTCNNKRSSGPIQFNASRTHPVKCMYRINIPLNGSSRNVLLPYTVCVLYRNSISFCTVDGWEKKYSLSSLLFLQWSLSVQLSTLVLLYSPSLLDSIFNLLVTRAKNIVSACCKCTSGSAGHQTINALLLLKEQSLLLNCTESL